MALKTVHFDVEGFSAKKAEMLSDMKTDIMCLQETHGKATAPNTPGMHIAANIKSNIYGGTILLRDKRLVEKHCCEAPWYKSTYHGSNFCLQTTK